MKLGLRIAVVGTSGAGKTTLSARLAARLGYPHIELDAFQHGPNWQQATAATATIECRGAARAHRPGH